MEFGQIPLRTYLQEVQAELKKGVEDRQVTSPKCCLSQVSGPGIEPMTLVQQPGHFTTRLLRRTKFQLGNWPVVLQSQNLSSLCKPQPLSLIYLLFGSRWWWGSSEYLLLGNQLCMPFIFVPIIKACYFRRHFKCLELLGQWDWIGKSNYGQS